MLDTVKLTGIVLTAMPIGEYDKRLTVLTKEKGKITAFVRGARKTKSPLMACSQPFTFAEFIAFQGKEAFNITAADHVNYFSELREQLDCVYCGIYFCELAGYFTRENSDEKDILKLLYQSLRALCSKQLDIRLVRSVFELKIITLSGEGPQVFSCVKCGRNELLSFFVIALGGMICKECNGSVKDSVMISESTLYALQHIVFSSVEKLYTFKVSDIVLKELSNIITAYLKLHMDREMKSLEMLDLILL